MKKMLGILLAVIMVLTLACAAAVAEDVPQPENGKKFEGDWAIEGALIEIDYEEEGYRVFIEAVDEEEMKGVQWNYNCYYVDDKDSLVSISSSKITYYYSEEDPDDIQYDEPAYEGLDEEGKNTEFTINDDGRLIWLDAHDNEGQDLEFINIGRFGGSWRNEAEEVDAEITWNGNDGEFFYNVWLQRGKEDADTFVVFEMIGTYNEQTGKLECTGTGFTYTKNADGEYDVTEDGETYEASFSYAQDGKLLFETANGIELEPFESNG